MKTITTFIISALLIAVASTCNKKKDSLPGMWKLQRVEVMQDGQLKKSIIDSAQYWNIHRRDSIEIFITKQLKNCLLVTFSKTSIKIIDPLTGFLLDEYFIDKLNKNQLELNSRQKVMKDDYNVIYYLDKVTGMEED